MCKVGPGPQVVPGAPEVVPTLLVEHRQTERLHGLVGRPQVPVVHVERRIRLPDDALHRAAPPVSKANAS